MKTTLTALALTLMCGLAVPAMANDIDAKTDHYMKKIDMNNDGMISQDEHEEFGDKMFTEADKNDDDSISRDELKAQKQKEHDEMKADMPKTKNMKK